tara:strand:- start:63 stop:302 length:240 start_codon:yes stop_codon:yes gene_type:complete
MYYKDLKLIILMFKYRYVICTKPVGKDDKYWTRKIIYLDNKIYQNEDQKYTKNQVFKILKSLDQTDYDKINNSILPQIV